MANIEIIGTPGAITVSGQNATSLLRTRLVTATVGTIAVTGQTGTLTFSGGPSVVATPASLTMTGVAARPRAGFTRYRNIYFPPSSRKK